MSGDPEEFHMKTPGVICDSDDEDEELFQPSAKPDSTNGARQSGKQAGISSSKNLAYVTQKSPIRTQKAANSSQGSQEQEKVRQQEKSEDDDDQSGGSSEFSESEESGSQESGSEQEQEPSSQAKPSKLQPRKSSGSKKIEPQIKKKPSAPKQPSRIVRTSEKQGILNRKQDIIQELLTRWWYVLPDWPPQDLDYTALLKEKKCRVVAPEMFQFQDEVNEEGLQKVIPVANYLGLYRRSDGVQVDVRPKDTMPCYANFKEKSKPELIDLLKRALQNQIRALKLTADYINKGSNVKLMKHICRLYLTVKNLEV